MAIRVKVPELKDIFETDLTNSQLEQFIKGASLLIDEELGNAGLSADRLKQIELYLSAHLASLNDPRMESEDYAGEYKFKVQGKTGMNLDATYYGQMAKFFDSTGTLDKLAENPKKATITVLGDAS